MVIHFFASIARENEKDTRQESGTDNIVLN